MFPQFHRTGYCDFRDIRKRSSLVKESLTFVLSTFSLLSSYVLRHRSNEPLTSKLVPGFSIESVQPLRDFRFGYCHLEHIRSRRRGRVYLLRKILRIRRITVIPTRSQVSLCTTVVFCAHQTPSETTTSRCRCLCVLFSSFIFLVGRNEPLLHLTLPY